MTIEPLTTEAAQRRLLEALAAFHREPDPTISAVDADPLGALLDGVHQAEADNTEAQLPSVAAIFHAFYDLIAAVRSDLEEHVDG